MQGKAVLVIGSLNMDMVANVHKLPIEGQTVAGSNFATFFGGKGGNQAVAAAKLQAPVTMVACVGDDSFGDRLIAGLAELNINTSNIRKVEAATGVALITVAELGKNTIVVISGANGLCDIEDVDRALESISEPGILVVQNEIAMDTVEYAIKKAKSLGWYIIYNPAPVKIVKEELLKNIDLITPNETEAAALTKINIKCLDEAKAAAKHLYEQGVKNVIITLGEKGAICLTKEHFKKIDAFKVAAIDTTAAGDSYTGALAAALSRGMSLEASLSLASLVAAYCVTKQGAQSSIPSLEELEEFAHTLGVCL